MFDYTTDDERRDHMARMEAKNVLCLVKFVMLHHECKVAGKTARGRWRIGASNARRRAHGDGSSER